MQLGESRKLEKNTRKVETPRGLNLTSQQDDVDLLLGADHHLLVAPIEIRRGKEQEPYAIRTPLGWIARGPVGENLEEKHATINYLETKTTTDVPFKRFWDAAGFISENEEKKETIPIKKKYYNLIILNSWTRSTIRTRTSNRLRLIKKRKIK